LPDAPKVSPGKQYVLPTPKSAFRKYITHPSWYLGDLYPVTNILTTDEQSLGIQIDILAHAFSVGSHRQTLGNRV
jgi:hypothetical protein